MTNTREEVAVAEAIGVTLFDNYGFGTNRLMADVSKAAISASNSKYVPQLVAALKAIYEIGDLAVASKVVAALSNLPEELKQ